MWLGTVARAIHGMGGRPLRSDRLHEPDSLRVKPWWLASGLRLGHIVAQGDPSGSSADDGRW